MGKPKIRFKGYQEDWEQRKLGELASSFEYGLNAAAKEYDGENKYIRITDIDDNTHEFLTDGLTSPDIDLNGAENYKLAEGDILFARTGASVGKSYIYKASDGLVYYAGFLIRARIKKEYDAEFIFQNTLTDKYNKYIAVTSQRSGQPGVNAQEYSEFEIQVPEKEEQTKIGTYFKNLDHLITLHQRKCEETKTLKKYMLQKMFPQNGQLVPEIRFSGFTEDWEQRKLSEVVKEIKRTDETSNAPVMMITAENGFINQSERYSTNNAGQSLKKYILLEKGELAYNHGASKLRPFGSCFSLTTEEKARIPFVYHCFSSDSENSEFLSIELNGKAVESQLRRIVSSGARMDGLLNISFQEYTSIPILLPERAEQDKIAEYFQSLDHLITLHQRKCDELRNIKKFMLQHMFI